MRHVISADGTRIGHDRHGSGPTVVLVGGGLDDGAENATLVPDLSRRFTAVNYARRGRGDSSDTPPYAMRPGFFDDAADAVAAIVPGARREVVVSDSHAVDAAVLAPVLGRFFTG